MNRSQLFSRRGRSARIGRTPVAASARRPAGDEAGELRPRNPGVAGSSLENGRLAGSAQIRRPFAESCRARPARRPEPRRRGAEGARDGEAEDQELPHSKSPNTRVPPSGTFLRYCSLGSSPTRRSPVTFPPPVMAATYCLPPTERAGHHRAEVELPRLLSGLRVEGDQLAVLQSDEHEPAGRGHGAAGLDGRLGPPLPHRLLPGGVDGARPRRHSLPARRRRSRRRCRARRACTDLLGDAVLVAQLHARQIDEFRLRIVRGVRPVPRPEDGGKRFSGGAPAAGRMPGTSLSLPVSGSTLDQMLMFLANLLALMNFPFSRSSVK